MDNQKYFVGIRDSKRNAWLYESDMYSFTEIDMINLIKICFVEGRNKSLGRKILAVYRDTTQHKKEESEMLLKNIGIEDDGNREPTKATSTKSK
jgi:hypothetical protein